ncbi:MAG: hypothetical protein ACRDBM_10290 [Sporomusa sp.]
MDKNTLFACKAATAIGYKEHSKQEIKIGEMPFLEKRSAGEKPGDTPLRNPNVNIVCLRILGVLPGFSLADY